MQTNVFLGGNADPLLGGSGYKSASDYDAKIAELQAMQQRLEQQKQQTNYFQKVNSSPTWDEIEKITAELSDREFDIINNNEEYQASQLAIAGMIQREQLKIVKPIIEASSDGKEALNKHLALIKKLQKEARQETNRSMELFTEYTEKYSDMTYADFLKMKKSKN